MSRLFADSSAIAITAFISPYISDRAAARSLHGSIPFIEVHINVSLAVAEARDPKGLYKKARAGEIKNFTGISAPYEVPESPEIRIEEDRGVEQAVGDILKYLEGRGLLKLGKRELIEVGKVDM